MRLKVLYSNLEIEYVKGSKNNLVDFLSRVSYDKSDYAGVTQSPNERQQVSPSNKKSVSPVRLLPEKPIQTDLDSPNKIFVKASQACLNHDVFYNDDKNLVSHSPAIPSSVKLIFHHSQKMESQKGLGKFDTCEFPNGEFELRPSRKFSTVNYGNHCGMFRILLEVSKKDIIYQSLVNCVKNKIPFQNLPPILQKEVCSSIYPNLSIFDKNCWAKSTDLTQKSS